MIRMKILLTALSACCLVCCYASESLEQPNITQSVLLYKSIITCTKEWNKTYAGPRPSETVKIFRNFHLCINQLWKQCLVMSTPQFPKGMKNWFPCNKGVTINSETSYIYKVYTHPSFHINITFLKFHLERTQTQGQCKIHRVQVRVLKGLYWY